MVQFQKFLLQTITLGHVRNNRLQKVKHENRHCTVQLLRQLSVASFKALSIKATLSGVILKVKDCSIASVELVVREKQLNTCTF